MIQIPQKFYLVVDDRFELFYRGALRKYNPYEHYVKATCDKGYTYNRYFTYTPKVGEEGEYELVLEVIDDNGEVIESAKTILVVNGYEKPRKKLNILCIGDSKTVNGVWPYTVFERFEKIYPGLLNFIGKMKKEEVGYEGYGGWQWKTFCFDETESRTSSVWVNVNNNLPSDFIHTKWINNNFEWILETICNDKLKFKRGKDNNLVNPKLEKTFVLKNDKNITLTIDNYSYSDANPFWNNETKTIDFKHYIKENNFPVPDIIFTFLTGNGLYEPYSNQFLHHRKYARVFLEQLHKDFPEAMIGIMGVELPCVNGGVTACYGASGYYHDWYGYAVTVFNYDKWLEELTYEDEYKSFMVYSDMKCQFDSENNYPYEMVKVNNRSQVLEKIGINGLHPSLDGYKQIGDAFYRFLFEIIRRKNEYDK